MNDDFEKDKLDTRTVIDTALGMLCLLALLWLRGSFIIDARLAPGFSGRPVFALVRHGYLERNKRVSNCKFRLKFSCHV